jgi:hypothetical protein
MTQLIDLGKLRFHFVGEWSSSAVYEPNDVVKYGGNVYVYIYGLKTSGNLPTNTTYWALMVEGFSFQGVYSSATSYQIGDGVTHGGKVYICIQDSTGNTPPNAAYWSQFADGVQWEGDYSAGAQYQKNDLVSYGGGVYVALQDTLGNAPSNASYWQKFVEGIDPSGVYNAATSYALNDVVAYGGNLYRALGDTTGNVPTNATYWEVFQSGIRPLGAWATSTAYQTNDVVNYGGSTYRCLIAHASSTFDTDLAAAKWEKYNSGVRWRGNWAASTSYQLDDIAYQGVSSYVCVQTHTSTGVFLNDLTAGKWTLFAEGGDYVLPTTVGNAGKYISSNGLSYVWATGESNWSAVSSAYTAVTGDRLLLNSSSGAFTVTLPASPSVGDFVQVTHTAGDLTSNSVTFARNGKLIVGAAEDLILDKNNVGFKLVYSGATNGWRIS